MIKNDLLTLRKVVWIKKGKIERGRVEQTFQFFLFTRYDVVFENNHSLDTFSTLVFVPGSKLESRHRSRETLTGLLRYTWCILKAFLKGMKTQGNSPSELNKIAFALREKVSWSKHKVRFWSISILYHTLQKNYKFGF